MAIYCDLLVEAAGVGEWEGERKGNTMLPDEVQCLVPASETECAATIVHLLSIRLTGTDNHNVSVCFLESD